MKDISKELIFKHSGAKGNKDKIKIYKIIFFNSLT